MEIAGKTAILPTPAEQQSNALPSNKLPTKPQDQDSKIIV